MSVNINMESLYTLSLSAVSSYVDSLSSTDEYMKDLTSLSPLMLLDLLQYLCPKILMSLHEHLLKLGINWNSLWEYHYRKRWPYKYQAEPGTFDLSRENWSKDFYKRYLRKHFHDILRLNLQDALGRRLNYMLISMANHKKKRLTKPSLETHSETVKELTNLKIYLPYISYLSIGASQCPKLLDHSILTHLRKSVSRLDIHTLKNEHFKCFAVLLGDLLQHGCLDELNVFNAVLDVKVFYSLLHLCAGHLMPTSSFTSEDVITSQGQIKFGNSTEMDGTSLYDDDLLLENKDDELHEWCDETEGELCSVSLFDDALQRVNHYVTSETSNPCRDQEVVRERMFSRYGSSEIADPECVCQHEPSGSTLPNFSHGLKAFSVISPSKMEPWLTDMYQGVLPNWSSLEAIYLCRVDLRRTDFATTVARCTGNPWRLKEIVVEDSLMNYCSLFLLLDGIVNCPTRKEPMLRLNIANVTLAEAYNNSVEETFPEKFRAFRTFELQNLTFDEDQTFLFDLVCRDKALRKLNLTSVTPKNPWFLRFLHSFHGQDLNTFQLSSVNINDSEEGSLCRVLTTMVNVRILDLSDMMLNSRFLASEMFLSTLSCMNKLQHLNVSNCRIGDNMATFLVKVLTRYSNGSEHPSPALRSVDISYTACSESALEEAAVCIVQDDCNRFGSAVKHLEVLNITGNPIDSPNFPEITQWRKLVHKLEASTEFCFLPFADYVSMM